MDSGRSPKPQRLLRLDATAYVGIVPTLPLPRGLPVGNGTRALFEPLPLVCPNCGADMRIVSFITEAAPVERILTHIGEPPGPLPIAPARGLPAWEDTPEPMPDWDLVTQPDSGYDFDQCLSG